MKNFQKLGAIFILSFALNLVWENLHSFLYTAYQGGPITEYILLRATLGDAVMLTILAVPFVYITALTHRLWLMVPIGVALAVWIELYALNAGRWSYNELMPLVPFVQVGLTPTVQLALLGWVTYWYVLRRQV
jgi:hypothetical protein